MTVNEQLRKEINELRERIAKLEARPPHISFDLMRSAGQQNPQDRSIKATWKYAPQNVWLGSPNLPVGIIT